MFPEHLMGFTTIVKQAARLLQGGCGDCFSELLLGDATPDYMQVINDYIY